MLIACWCCFLATDGKVDDHDEPNEPLVAKLRGLPWSVTPAEIKEFFKGKHTFLLLINVNLFMKSVLNCYILSYKLYVENYRMIKYYKI